MVPYHTGAIRQREIADILTNEATSASLGLVCKFAEGFQQLRNDEKFKLRQLEI